MVVPTSTTGSTRAPSGIWPAASSVQTATYVVFAGDCPNADAQRHSADALWWFGEEVEYESARTGRIEPGDSCVPLEQAWAGQSAWMLIRPRSGKSKRVMVVEDNKINLDYYTEVLVATGLTVHGAESGSAAVALAERMMFDLVICDIRLPDTNGFELCRALANCRGAAGAALLLMSADPHMANNPRIAEVGAHDFVVNPITPTALVDRVQHVLVPETAHSAALPATGTAAIELQFFGEPAVVLPDTRIPMPTGRMGELIATLAAGCPVAISTDRLAHFIGHGETLSHNAVYTAISRLRTHLATAGAPDLVVTEGSGYALSLTSDHVDLSVFERSARRIIAEPETRTTQNLRDVLSDWQGRPFADSPNPLLHRWGVRLSEARARLLELLARHLLDDGDVASCTTTCQDLLASEPWRENVWGLLVVALYRHGRSNDALVAFRTAQHRMRSELGLDPGPMLAGLELMVLSHDPQLDDSAWLESLVAR